MHRVVWPDWCHWHKQTGGRHSFHFAHTIMYDHAIVHEHDTIAECKTRVERCRDLVRGAYEGRQPSGALSRVLTKVLVSGVLEFEWRGLGVRVALE